MALNFKNEQVHAMAFKLAKIKGTSITQAVGDAVRSELKRVKSKKKMSLSDELLEIGRRCAAHMRKGVTSEDHGSMLYDERGLPK